jgi:hypothetical protein
VKDIFAETKGLGSTGHAGGMIEPLARAILWAMAAKPGVRVSKSASSASIIMAAHRLAYDLHDGWLGSIGDHLMCLPCLLSSGDRSATRHAGSVCKCIENSLAKSLALVDNSIACRHAVMTFRPAPRIRGEGKSHDGPR